MTSLALDAEEYIIQFILDNIFETSGSWNYLVGLGFPKDMYFTFFKNIYIEHLQRSTKVATNKILLKEIRGNTLILILLIQRKG